MDAGDVRTVVFTAVAGYHLLNDAFGNIIFALEEVSVERLLAEHGGQIVESYRISGAPGPWAADLTSAAQLFADEGMKGFMLSSSYGLSGWIIAGDYRVEPRDPSALR